MKKKQVARKAEQIVVRLVKRSSSLFPLVVFNDDSFHLFIMMVLVVAASILEKEISIIQVLYLNVNKYCCCTADKLAALWPFLGICAEVVILCTIIFIYEKRRAKKMEEEEMPEEAGHL